MIQHPALTDERGDVAQITPEGGEQSNDGFFDVIEGGVDAVTDLVLELIEELLDGVEFRAVGRELEQVDALGDGMAAGFGVEASSVPDDDVLGLLVALGELAQDEVAGFQIHRGTEEELR